MIRRRAKSCLVATAVTIGALGAASTPAHPQSSILEADLGGAERVFSRLAVAARPLPPAGPRAASMSPADRRAAVDATWGPGESTASKLQTFDTFWSYVDARFAAFQGIDVDWRAMRDRYRPEIAAGVSRGRFAAIINHMSVALRDGHTIPWDLGVNLFTLPEPGVPLFGIGGWMGDTSGACLTAQDDGSALVYDVRSPHPLGLQRGDRILGYDGKPWRDLYQQLLDEELPMWPLWWGSGPEGFEHSFVMSAGLNWHLFDTMDVFKQQTQTVAHVPTSLMPGVVWSRFCSEQLAVGGVPKPTYYGGDYVRWGVVNGTNVGYIYVWGWLDPAADQFAAAVREVTQVRHVDGLILDFRFNTGGYLGAPFTGLAALFPHPTASIGMDVRMRPDDHLKMKNLGLPGDFKLDFDWDRTREGNTRGKMSYDGPVAVLTGPGAISAGDFATLWADLLPRARTFGKSTAMAAGMPTQPALGTVLDMGPDWDATIAETNTYRVGAPHDYLIHTDFVPDERVWLRPQDVAAGRDTVVEAALRWLGASP